MKEIKNIEKTLKIGDEFQIEYTPKYNDKGQDQVEQKEILGINTKCKLIKDLHYGIVKVGLIRQDH